MLTVYIGDHDELETLSLDCPKNQEAEEEDDIHPESIRQFDQQKPAITKYEGLRRKSIIPVDETVYRELSNHISLEDVVNQKRGGNAHDLQQQNETIVQQLNVN